MCIDTVTPHGIPNGRWARVKKIWAAVHPLITYINSGPEVMRSSLDELRGPARPFYPSSLQCQKRQEILCLSALARLLYFGSGLGEGALGKQTVV